VVSDIDGASLKSICPSVRSEIVPNGVDTEYFKPSSAPVKNDSLIYVGGMTWYPNLDAMLYFTREVWHLIVKEVPDLTMTLIGRQPSSQIADFCAKNRAFRSLGFIDDVRPYISESAVYVVPIRVGGGTRLKILDAMAMGKAIVSTSVGCEGIGVTNGKDIVIADSPDQIAGETVHLLRDAVRREELGRNARQTAERLYSWDVVYPKLDAVYTKLSAMKKK
jgi:glycosyltransferase involved in cell wall biosynthesis